MGNQQAFELIIVLVASVLLIAKSIFFHDEECKIAEHTYFPDLQQCFAVELKENKLPLRSALELINGEKWFENREIYYSNDSRSYETEIDTSATRNEFTLEEMHNSDHQDGYLALYDNHNHNSEQVIDKKYAVWDIGLSNRTA